MMKDNFLFFFHPLRLNPRGGRQTGIPVYEVLKGVSKIKVKE